MRRIVLLGTGNVARHLFDAIQSSELFDIIQVAGRREDSLDYFRDRSSITTNFSALQDAELYLMAVSDDAIAALAKEIGKKNALLVHTSGSTPISDLPHRQKRGVFYPLQTFSRDVELDFQNIPICLEAESEEDYELLEALAAELSDKILRVESEQRMQLHISAVYVNNFVNHLFQIGHEICREQGLPFEVLKPLILETVRKIENVSPYEAQTGPARRQDTKILNLHSERISNENYKRIYSTISNSIKETYGKKL